MNRITVATLFTLIAVFASTAGAAADQVEITAQAKAIRAEFLLRVPPPATPAAVCLVDTGVNANPDTTNVFARISLPKLDGSDQSPTLHGTQMAMLMGGASNSYGMVGIWPSARIVSVQANLPGQDAFTVATYVQGIRECDKTATVYGTKVIVVAVASELRPEGEDAIELADVVVTARNHGLNVVVAAGNNELRPIGTPADVPGAFSVGATDGGSGALCPISATGALLLAPGCAIDGADPLSGTATRVQQGTSAAAAIAGTAIAALRTWRPDLTPDVVEQLVNTTAIATDSGRRLDLTAAFIAAGLEPVTAPPESPAATPTPIPAMKRRLAKPRLTVRQRGRGNRRTLTIRKLEPGSRGEDDGEGLPA